MMMTVLRDCTKWWCSTWFRLRCKCLIVCLNELLSLAVVRWTRRDSRGSEASARDSLWAFLALCIDLWNQRLECDESSRSSEAAAGALCALRTARPGASACNGPRDEQGGRRALGCPQAYTSLSVLLKLIRIANLHGVNVSNVPVSSQVNLILGTEWHHCCSHRFQFKRSRSPNCR